MSLAAFGGEKKKAVDVADQHSKNNNNDTFIGTNNNTADKKKNDSPSSSPSPRLLLPTGLRLIMMGDSLTRYQYISLVYFLRHSQWIEPNSDPHFVNEKTFGNWSHFYNATTTATEESYCDCYRSDTNLDAGHIIENRYFYDHQNDNRVIFITAFGHEQPMHGRLNSSTAMSFMSSGPSRAAAVVHQDEPFAWKSSDWKQVVEEHASGFGATHLLFNAGYWMNNFHDPATFLNFTGALHERGIQPIWKSTTYNRGHGMTIGHFRKYKRVARRDARIWRQSCRLPSNSSSKNTTWCVDLRWTSKVNASNYFDELHFVEPVYRVMNEELLELLGHIFPPTYVKQRKDVLLEGYNATV